MKYQLVPYKWERTKKKMRRIGCSVIEKISTINWRVRSFFYLHFPHMYYFLYLVESLINERTSFTSCTSLYNAPLVPIINVKITYVILICWNNFLMRYTFWLITWMPANLIQYWTTGLVHQQLRTRMQEQYKCTYPPYASERIIQPSIPDLLTRSILA